MIKAAHIFCLTHGLTRSWRNGDAQCCQLSNIADTFSNFFPPQKAHKPYLVSENRRYCRARSCFPSTRTHLSLSPSVCSVSVQRAHTHISLSRSLHLLSFCSVHGREEQCLIQLNTDIIVTYSSVCPPSHQSSLSSHARICRHLSLNQAHLHLI